MKKEALVYLVTQARNHFSTCAFGSQFEYKLMVKLEESVTDNLDFVQFRTPDYLEIVPNEDLKEKFIRMIIQKIFNSVIPEFYQASEIMTSVFNPVKHVTPSTIKAMPKAKLEAMWDAYEEARESMKLFDFVFKGALRVLNNTLDVLRKETVCVYVDDGHVTLDGQIREYNVTFLDVSNFSLSLDRKSTRTPQETIAYKDKLHEEREKEWNYLREVYAHDNS